MGEPICGSVLLSDKIKEYSLDPSINLIVPFNRNNLKPASYKLTIGDECSIGGRYITLTKDNNKGQIVIPPFEVVIIKTAEKINMPRDLIARWNIRVTLAYQGLVWVGGPQVDPGYKGNLFCPIYNLSDQEVVLEMGEPIATIDFIKTTSFDDKKCLKFVQKRNYFKEYNFRLKSALYTNASQRLDKVEKGVERYTSLFLTALGVMFTMMVINMSFLSMLISSTKTADPTQTFPWWMYTNLFISVVAIAISICTAIFKFRTYQGKVGTTQKSLLIVLIIIVIYLFFRVHFPKIFFY